MELVEVKTLTNIQVGDTIVITGHPLKNKAVEVLEVKVTEQDGTEIIYNRQQNYYFNLGMYLDGRSWVKDIKILR